MTMTEFDSFLSAFNWTGAAGWKSDLTRIVWDSVVNPKMKSGINIACSRAFLRNKAIRPKIYKTSIDYNDSMITIADADPKYISGMIPNALAYNSCEEFEANYASTRTVGEVMGIENDGLLVIQLTDNPTLPDVKYNVFIHMHPSNMPFTDVIAQKDYSEAEFNIMGLSGKTPQEFSSEFVTTKTKISKIGQPVAADEYDIKSIMTGLYLRESNLAKKHGNLKTYTASNWKPGTKYIQIAKEISKDETIIILNHKFSTPPKDILNGVVFNTLLFIPVGTTIDQYIAEEKIKKTMIKNKLLEVISARTGA